MNMPGTDSITVIGVLAPMLATIGYLLKREIEKIDTKTEKIDTKLDNLTNTQNSLEKRISAIEFEMNRLKRRR